MYLELVFTIDLFQAFNQKPIQKKTKKHWLQDNGTETAKMQLVSGLWSTKISHPCCTL